MATAVGVAVTVGVAVRARLGFLVGVGVGGGVAVGTAVDVGTGVAMASSGGVELSRGASGVGDGEEVEVKATLCFGEGAFDLAKDVGVAVWVAVGSGEGGSNVATAPGPSVVGLGVAWATSLAAWLTPTFVTTIIPTPTTKSPTVTKAIGAEGRTVHKRFIKPLS